MAAITSKGLFACGAECGMWNRGFSLALPTDKTVHFTNTGSGSMGVVTSGPTPMLSTRCFSVSGIQGATFSVPYASEAVRIYAGAISVYFKDTLPDRDTRILTIPGAGSLYFKVSNSGIVAAMGTETQSTPVVVNTWYNVSWLLNASANPRTLKLRINTTSVAQITQAVAAADIFPATTHTSFVVGSNVNFIGGNIYLDNIILVGDAAGNAINDHPINKEGFNIAGLYPGSDGVHNYSAIGDFTKNGSTATNLAVPSTSETTAWQSLVNPLVNVPTIGKYIADVGASASEYLRFNLANLPADATEVDAVMPISTAHSAATTPTNGILLSIFDVSSGLDEIKLMGDRAGPTGQDISDTDIQPWVTRAYTGLNTGAWTVPNINDLGVHFGATDVDPDVYLDGVCLEVAYRTVQTGSITPVNFTLTPQALTFPITNQNTLISPVSLTLSPQALAKSVGGVSSTITPVNFTLTPQALAKSVGTAPSTLTPVSLTLSPQALAKSVGGVSSTITPVNFTLFPMGLIRLIGTAPSTLTPVSLTFSPTALVRTVGGTATTSITPANLTLLPVALTRSATDTITRSITPVNFTLFPMGLIRLIGGTATTSISPTTFTFAPIVITGFVEIPGVGNILPALFTLTPQALAKSIGGVSTLISPAGMTLIPQSLTRGTDDTSGTVIPVIFTFTAQPLTYSMGSVSTTLISVILTLTPTPINLSLLIGGKPKVWTGIAWVEKPVKVWTGTVWVEKPMKVWSGSEWELV